MAAFRILWTALVGLYEETVVLLGGNLATVALNLPIAVLIVLLGLPFASSGDFSTIGPLAFVSAWLLPFVPTPGNIALANLTRAAAGPDVTRFSSFALALRRQWRLAVRCSLISGIVLGALVANVAFYAGLGPGWPLFVTIIWAYATLFWLSLHMYLVPLAVHVAEPRVFDLYRRATFIALGHPGFTFVLLLELLVLSFASVVFLPVYVLVAQSFVSLAQAHALREIRRRHGDLAIDAEEEVSRL